MTDQLDKVTSDSIKKSTTIEELHRDSSNKKAAKVDDLRNQRTGLRKKLDKQATLLQTGVDERDSELDNVRHISVGSEYEPESR